VLTAALLFLVGCSLAPQPGSKLPGEPSAPALGQLTPDEQKAVDLAQAFLAKNQADWGSPTKVERSELESLPNLKGDSWSAIPRRPASCGCSATAASSWT
jgi:hypothetical protein